MRLLLLLLLVLPIQATEELDGWDLPRWILPGMLMRESSSYFDTDGKIVYVDKKVGEAGEIGPYQMTFDAWDEIKKPGEKFSRMKTDLEYAEECAVRYLYYIYNEKAAQSWPRAVGMYHAGWGTDRKAMNRRTRYVVAIRKFGGG